MASPYFAGNPLQSPAAAELTEAAHKVVKVRAHTRKIKPKPAKRPTPVAAQVNTQTVRPAQVSTEKRFVPHRPDEPVAGYAGALKHLDGSWAKPGGKASPGAYLAERPYYTDKYTTRHGGSPAGQESTQWNAAQVAKAKKIQVANYGKPGTVLRSLLPGGADEGGINTSNAVGRIASVATTALPGGGVGEAAGLLGLGLKGLKGLRAGSAVKDVAEVAPKVAEAAPKVAGKVVPPRTTTIEKPPASDVVATKRWNRFLDLENRDTPMSLSEHAEAVSLRAEFTRPTTAAERAAEASRTAAAAPKTAHVAAKAVPPHVSRGQEFVGSLPDTAREPGYLYHRAPAASLPGIRKSGLTPKKPAGDNPPGVYFGNEPLQAQGLAQKATNSVYLRVKKDAVPGVEEKAFGESLHRGSVPPSDLEYLGADGAWHPAAPKPVARAAGGGGRPPTEPPGAPPAAGGPENVVPPPEPAAVVRGSMRSAKATRKQQEAGYSAERAKRVAAARAYLDDPKLAPDERVRLAKKQLAGELPKINWGGFSELNDESLKALQEHVLNHPHLMPFQKIRTSDALVNALAGKVPTRSEIVLLEHVFGKDTAAGLGEIAKHPYKDMLLNVLNIPRSLMASFDLSAPFRQGLVVATRHPKIFAKNFGPMIKAFGNEAVYHGMIDEIRARPSYPLMVEAKLPITELAGDVGGREERFASSYAETLTGGKYSPVRASGRAYTGYLDKTRADVFDHLLAKAQSQGVNVQDQHFLESLGRYIGSATGRGQLRHFEQAAPALNAIFFSPRLMASRFNFINPAYYARLDPFARKEALRSALQLAGTASTLVALASRVPGVKVQTDPRNPDWGKIKIGNTRIDIGGGFQQELRFLAQIASGVAISSTTGKSLSLTTREFGKPTRLDIAQRYFMGKESPIASLVTDYLRGSTQIGEPFSWQSAAATRMTPLLAQSSLELYKEQHGGMNGLAAAFAGYGVGSVGFGVQTYGPVKPKTKAKAPADYFGGGGSGGGSPYFSSPSGSSGGGYFSK